MSCYCEGPTTGSSITAAAATNLTLSVESPPSLAPIHDSSTVGGPKLCANASMFCPLLGMEVPAALGVQAVPEHCKSNNWILCYCEGPTTGSFPTAASPTSLTSSYELSPSWVPIHDSSTVGSPKLCANASIFCPLWGWKSQQHLEYKQSQSIARATRACWLF